MRPVTKTFKPGSYLFHENDHSRELYILQSGSVRIFRKIGGKEIPLAVVGKGSVLGEMALIDGKPRSASAQAVEDCQVVLIDSDTFHSKTRGVPPWFLSIIRMTSFKIRKANDRLQKAHSCNSGANIILALGYLFSRAQKRSPECFELNLQKTCTQLIQLLGTPNHRVMKALDFLSQHGFIEMGEQSVTLADKERFDEYCRFLRLFLRKALDKIQPIPNDTAEMVFALAEQNPEIISPVEQTITVNGDDLWLLLSDLGLAKIGQKIVDSLSEVKLLLISKDDGEGEGANPLSGKTYSAKSGPWMMYYLFNKYKLMVPAL